MSKRKDQCFVELYKEQTMADGAPPMVAGLPEALSLAQKQGVRCIAVTNAQRGAGEAAIASLRAHIPAAAICWTTYEAAKRTFGCGDDDDAGGGFGPHHH